MSRVTQSERTSPGSASTGSLISEVSWAVLWNSVLLPVSAVLNLAFAVLIRRRFGLFSGVYDVLLGLTSTVVQYSRVGIGTALLKFLPEVSETKDASAPRRLLLDAVLVRMVLLLVVLVPLNLFVEPVARILDLGPSGRLYIGLASGLAVARALLEMMLRTLHAFLSQMWSNLIAVLQTLLELAIAGAVLALGYEMGGVFAGLVAAAGVAALLGVGAAAWQLAHLKRQHEASGSTRAEFDSSALWFAGEGRRFFRFSIFTYAFGLSAYFTGIGFVAPALAVVLSTEEVALFATAYKFAFRTVSLVVAPFHGVYRPLFARVRARNDRAQLQQTFTVVSKAQLLVLLPAAFGLTVMAGDYVPLLFGEEFEPAVPMVWILAAFTCATTVFNLSGIVLSIDEQYRAIAWVRAPVLLAVPLFLLASVRGGLLPATVIFGATNLLIEVLSYAICRRLYGFRFPWMFAAKVSAVSGVMAVVLAVGRLVWATSSVEAVVLTVVGSAVFCVGLRLNQVFEPDDLMLLRRTRLPGHGWIVNWLALRGR